MAEITYFHILGQQLRVLFQLWIHDYKRRCSMKAFSFYGCLFKWLCHDRSYKIFASGFNNFSVDVKGDLFEPLHLNRFCLKNARKREFEAKVHEEAHISAFFHHKVVWNSSPSQLHHLCKYVCSTVCRAQVQNGTTR